MFKYFIPAPAHMVRERYFECKFERLMGKKINGITCYGMLP